VSRAGATSQREGGAPTLSAASPRSSMREFNASGDSTMVVPGEYVEAVITK
jgi:hypothetical protein